MLLKILTTAAPMSWLWALRALAVQQQGLQHREAGIRLSVELSAGCKAKKQETLSRQTPILIQKEKPYTVIEELTLPQDRSSRKGEKSSVKGTTKEVLP